MSEIIQTKILYYRENMLLYSYKINLSTLHTHSYSTQTHQDDCSCLSTWETTHIPEVLEYIGRYSSTIQVTSTKNWVKVGLPWLKQAVIATKKIAFPPKVSTTIKSCNRSNNAGRNRSKLWHELYLPKPHKTAPNSFVAAK